ncbi:MAG: hypothetical protein M0P01_05110 [Treponema sp.]|nr:hypothetical protein [Treponema sp.]
MKEIRTFFVIFCVIFFPAVLNAGQAVQQDKESLYGLSLCRNTENFLIQNGFTPKKLNLVKSVKNNFPYNIEVDFNGTTGNIDTKIKNRHTLILAFTMEDAYQYRNYISIILDTLKKTTLAYNLILLFSYGDFQSKTDNYRICGTNIFAGNIDNPDDYSAVCISFTQDHTVVLIPGGAGETSPSWLVKRLSDSLISANLPYHLRGGSLGSLYRLKILKADERSSFFLQEGIPCTGIAIPVQADMSAYAECTADFISAYTPEGTDSWDRHYIAFHAGNTLWWASEQFIVICFITISFISLFMLSELSFIRNKRHYEIKRDVFRLWYILPVTAVISAVCFQVSQPLTQFLYHIFKITILYQFVVKIIITFAISTILYLLIVKFQGVLEERAYAYLLTIDSVINIFIFSAVDISLFFLFAAEYIIVYIFRPFKRTGILFAEFAVMLIPYLPYIKQITGYADPVVFNSFVYSGFSGNILLSIASLPFLFQWLRIIARFNVQWNYYEKPAAGSRIKNVLYFTGAAAAVTIVLLSGIKHISAHITSKNDIHPEKNISVKRRSDSVLSCTSADKSFFGDTTRTLTVNLGKNAEYCIISVNGMNGNSVIYSDDEYISDKIKYTDTFPVPVWPPEKIVISYVADISVPAVVTVTAFYEEADSVHAMRTYEITIPPSEKRTEAKT